MQELYRFFGAGKSISRLWVRGEFLNPEQDRKSRLRLLREKINLVRIMVFLMGRRKNKNLKLYRVGEFFVLSPSNREASKIVFNHLKERFKDENMSYIG